MVQLEGLDNTTGRDYDPQITAVGTAGEYVVTFYGNDSAGDYLIFVQKFHADGTVAGSMAQIDVANASYDNNWSPQITALGTAGEFAVTFTGTDSNGNDSIFVQKFHADGTIVDMHNAMIIDTTAPSLAITTADTTNSPYPDISGTAEAGSTITLTIAGATYTTTTAIGGTWNIYTGNNPTSGTFTLDPNGGNSVSVTATDAAGNIAAATQTLTVDTVAPATIAPTGFTVTDTGVSATDGITSNPTLTVALASDTATWRYSLNNGNSWNTGSGNTITLPDGTYDKHFIQVEQTDAAGNSSISAMSATSSMMVVDTTAPVFSSSATASTHDNITTSTVVYDAQTTENDTGMSYSISGVDATLFNLNATTGVVTFVSAPSIGAPADNGANNVYDFTITATDIVGHTTDQAVALSVTPSLAGLMFTSNGVSFTLGAESVQNGKSYYYVTNTNGLPYISHNVLDTAFNGGADTVDTTVTAGVDDARTFVSGGVTFVLPTATELLALSPSTPSGWTNGAWYQSATQTSADNHKYVSASSHASMNVADADTGYVVLQVIPA